MDDESDLNNVAKLKHNVLVQIGAMSNPKKQQGTFYRSQHEQDNCKNHYGKIEGCMWNNDQ